MLQKSKLKEQFYDPQYGAAAGQKQRDLYLQKRLYAERQGILHATKVILHSLLRIPKLLNFKDLMR